MDEGLVLKNNLKRLRKDRKLSQQQLADLIGVSRNTISSIETGQFNPTAKPALILLKTYSIFRRRKHHGSEKNS